MKSIVRMLVLLGMGVIGAALVFLLWNSDTGYAYRKHWQTEDRLTLDFNRLQMMSQPQAAALFPINWFCRSGQSEFGDAFCADELQRWNDLEALGTVFFYESGQLVFVKVDVPPWAHGDLRQALQQNYGAPAGYTSRIQWGKVLLAAAAKVASAGVGVPVRLDMAPDELGVWHLPSGAWLVSNMKADWLPWQWSTVFWMSPKKVVLLNARKS
ncbi:MAG: hypothetical protein Fur0026_11140 [Sideroxydans sp.]